MPGPWNDPAASSFLRGPESRSFMRKIPMTSLFPKGREREHGDPTVWDRRVTWLLVLLLAMPLPFARFETWPGGTVISEHPVTPWSRFRICFWEPPEGAPREERYEFTWKGQVLPRESPPTLFLDVPSLRPPALKWQDNPEIPLDQSFFQGHLVRLETYWQPLILWPFRMLWRSASSG